MRLVVLLGFLSCAALVPGCTNTCAGEGTMCNRSGTLIEVPLSVTNQQIAGARLEMCNDGRCEQTFIEVKGPQLSCPAPLRVGEVHCSREDGQSPLVLVWTAAYGGNITVRIVTRSTSGSEQLIAERTGTMTREDYVVSQCQSETTCTQWKLR